VQSDRDVLHALFDRGPVTRPELAALTSLSKPTVSGSIRRLQTAGLLREIGPRRGLPGRAPTCYQVDPVAGFVIGVDVGGTNLRVLVADLLGATVAEERRRTVARGGAQVVRQIAELTSALVDQLGLDSARLLAVAVSTPGVIDPGTDRVSYAYNIGESDPFDLRGPLARLFDVPLLIENNVNCAALGEQRLGLARAVPSFAFISIGAGVGMGLVYRDQLVRGTHGAAGEIGYLPLAADPFAPEHRRRGALEDQAGAAGILELATRRTDWPGRPPETVEEIFLLAAGGSRPAAEVVEAEGRMIGMGVAALATVVDPTLVVLGGGIGSNPLLLPSVRRSVAAILPFPPDIATSQLGASASLHGAVALALSSAREALFERILAGNGDELPSVPRDIAPTG
jgi:predicted NBD/HSP70 family sugar kinase